MSPRALSPRWRAAIRRPLSRALPLAFALVIAAMGAAVPGCLELRDEARPDDENPCARCHGSPEHRGGKLLQAAPPFDVKGNRDLAYPGVGAHRAHLYESDTHAPVACAECHRVPKRTEDRGHIDSDAPAELSFGELAKTGGRTPHYGPRARRCADTYCHGATSPVWTHPRDSARACGSCHGLPPALPHPQTDDCAACHGDVIAADGNFVAKELHINGTVEVDTLECNTCHGSESSSAPPKDLSGRSSVTARGVGAHQVHLSGGEAGRALACEECHQVPDDVVEAGHLDGSGMVETVMSGVAVAEQHAARWDPETLRCSNTWCHGVGGDPQSPRWTSAGPLDCTSCHAMPPPAPHPAAENCSLCHGEVVGPQGNILDRERHVDGELSVEQPSGCTDCHGSEQGDPLGAPPRDTLGNTETTRAGVGAHTAHLVGRSLARVLDCTECHRVPASVDAEGHIDSSLPAEVTMAGVGAAFLAEPIYEGGRCANTYCHGGRFIGDRPSGGTDTEPRWTVSDPGSIGCDGCHGMPPPLPHPQAEAPCSDCHKNAQGSAAFAVPDLHVDGKVTFFLSREQAEAELGQ